MKKIIILTENPSDIPDIPTEYYSPCRPNRDFIIAELENKKSFEFGGRNAGSKSHGATTWGSKSHGAGTGA
jgi:hypothetical protein